mmetsp:Transcript_10496/g.27533  ORF Transcript_10496/g.27533 Transcript_10496/m.27533 type:complete len:363 (-) Transcript_10496:289-1377(-)
MMMMKHPCDGLTQQRRRMFVVALTLGIENEKNREAWIKGSRAISFRIQEWTMEYLASGRKQLVRDVTRGSGSESAEMEDENLGMGPRNKSKPAFSPDEDEQDVSIKEVLSGREPPLYMTPFYVEGSWALDPFAFMYNALKRKLMDLYAMMPYFAGNPEERYCNGLKDWFNWFSAFLRLCFTAENEQLIPWANSASGPGKAGTMARRSVASFKESQAAVVAMQKKLLFPEKNGLASITPYLAQLDELAFALTSHFKLGETQLARIVRQGCIDRDGPVIEDAIVMMMMKHPCDGLTQQRRRMFVVALTLGIENEKNREAWIKGSRAVSNRIQVWTLDYLASGRKRLVRDVTRKMKEGPAAGAEK